MTAELPAPSSRRRKLVLWVRNGLTIAILLSIPTLLPILVRVVDPQRDREEIAQALERKQRSGGEPVVLPSGEVRRAVVYTPARSSFEDTLPHRALSWWARLMSAALLIATIRGTLQLGHSPAEQAHAASRPRGP